MTTMRGGPWSGQTFAYFGAHAMRQEDGTVVLAWSGPISCTDSGDFSRWHTHRFRYSDAGDLVGNELSGPCSESCHYWRHRPTDTQSAPFGGTDALGDDRKGDVNG